MRSRVRLEGDAVIVPPSDVTPGEVSEPPATVRYVPSIEPARIVGDDETDRVKSDLAKHRKRMRPQPAVRVVERDEDLTSDRPPLATHARGKLGERHPAPPAACEREDLLGEAAGREPGDAELSPALDLVVAQHGRNHTSRGSKPRTVVIPSERRSRESRDLVSEWVMLTPGESR